MPRPGSGAAIEVPPRNQALLRFQVMGERQWPDEVRGGTFSVRCVGEAEPEAG